jgi:hypothetical protein
MRAPPVQERTIASHPAMFLKNPRRVFMTLRSLSDFKPQF